MNEAAQEASKSLTQIEQISEEVRKAVNFGIGLLPSDVQTTVRNNWDEYSRGTTNFFASLTLPMQSPGDPPVMRAGAVTWMKDVGRPCANEAALVEIERLETDDNWKGKAASAYVALASLDHKALTAILDEYVAHIVAAMSTASEAVNTYWWTFVGILVAEIVALIAAAAATGTIVGIPVAIIGMVLALAAALAANEAARAAARATMRSAVTEIQSGNRGVFVNGWPAPKAG